MTLSVLFVSSGLADENESISLSTGSSDESSSSTDDTSDFSGSSDATSGDSIGSTETSNNVVSDGGDPSADDSASEPSIGDDNSVDAQGDSADDPSIANTVEDQNTSEDNVEKSIPPVLGDKPGQRSIPQGNEPVYFQLLSVPFDVSYYHTKTAGATGQQEETELQEDSLSDKKTTIDNIQTENNHNIHIAEVTLKPVRKIGDIVSNIPGKPQEFPDVYLENKDSSNEEYVKISPIGDNDILTNGGTNSIKIEFQVDKSWIEQKNIDKESIVIKFRESVSEDNVKEWQVLSQTPTSEDENYLYLEVTTDSPYCLATFAIIGSETVKINSYSTQGGEISWTAIIGVIVVATFLLLVILFKAGYIYTEEYHIKKPKKIQNHRNINIIRQTVIVLLFWI